MPKWLVTTMAVSLLLGTTFLLFLLTKESEAISAQKLVKQVIKLYTSRGIDATIDAINKKKRFVFNDIYAFVYNDKGLMIANPLEPKLIGRNILQMIDVNGRNVGELFMREASPQGSWVIYKWKNPVSKRTEWKASWLKQVDNYIFGSGIHLSPE